MDKKEEISNPFIVEIETLYNVEFENLIDPINKCIISCKGASNDALLVFI